MTGILIGGWVWFCVGVFVVGCLWKAFRYATAPVHLRWDLYPVAHEPRRDHGGSYLEEREWWTKPRRKDRLGELGVMAAEILLLKGVWEHNRRVWWGSLMFHWGLYLLTLTTVGLGLEVVGLARGWLVPMLAVTGTAGGAGTAVGALILLGMRAFDPLLRPYTSPADRANLLVLCAFGTLSAFVAAWTPGMETVARRLADPLRFRGSAMDPLWAAQMAVGGLFLLYFPATRMVHFFAKYFTYHKVRWDDEPVAGNPRLAARLSAALDFGVDWSASHVQTGRTWAEVATELPEATKGGGND